MQWRELTPTDEWYSHYDLHRTIEEILNIEHKNKEGDNARIISDIWNP